MRPITRPMPLRRPNYDRKLARVLVHNLAGNPLTGNNSGFETSTLRPGTGTSGCALRMRGMTRRGHDRATADQFQFWRNVRLLLPIQMPPSHDRQRLPPIMPSGATMGMVGGVLLLRN